MILQYKGITKSGEKITGEFLGTKEELIKSLQKEGILLISATQNKRKLKGGKYTLTDFSSDIEELSYLVASGLQINKAISTLIKNLKKKTSIDLWEDVLSEIRKGKQLSIAIKKALEKHNIKIGDFYINIISVGEEVGNIQDSLKDVSRHLQFKTGIIKDTISALTYPAFLIFVSIAAIFFIAYFILPRFATIFTPKDLQHVPALSRTFIQFGQFVHNNAGAVLFSFFMFIALIFIAFSNDKLRGVIIEASQKLPFIRDIALEIHIANICSSIGVMLKGGVDVAKAIRLAGKIVSHKNLKNIMQETADGLRKGLKISDVWSKYNIIPDDVISLVAVGESSATLPEVFDKLGNRHLDNFKTKVAKAMTFLEPAMIVVLGVFIGIIVVSIMLAVLSLTNVS